MQRPKPLACSGVKSGVLDGTSDARDAPNDVRSGARVQLRVRLQRVQLPAQLSNSTGSATLPTERSRRGNASPSDDLHVRFVPLTEVGSGLLRMVGQRITNYWTRGSLILNDAPP
jgi:hypothetical protein